MICLSRLCGRGVIFKGTTIGMAPLEGMCSLENSGGINVVRLPFSFFMLPLSSSSSSLSALPLINVLVLTLDQRRVRQALLPT